MTSRFRLEPVMAMDEAVIGLPVLLEVLQGFRDEAAFRTAQEAMDAFPIVESPMRREVFGEAVELYRRARRAGLTIRSGVDCVIAACAQRNHLTVLHHDRDFSKLSRISSLQVREIGV